jgi:uncharacterized protein (DUF983 family)
MSSSNSKFKAIITQKCPKCHDGHLWGHPNPYKLSVLTHMNKSCQVCGENFLREPGFYFGAAFVSYGLTVGLWIAVLVALLSFDAMGVIEFSFFENPLTFFISGLVALLAALPFIYRLSRSIWIHFFVKFDASAAEKPGN